MIEVVISPQQLNVNATAQSVGVNLGNPVIREGGGGNLPAGGNENDLLMKRSNADYDAQWVTPANSAEQDNTRPITSAAVYTEIGNINALLATI